MQHFFLFLCSSRRHGSQAFELLSGRELPGRDDPLGPEPSSGARTPDHRDQHRKDEPQRPQGSAQPEDEREVSPNPSELRLLVLVLRYTFSNVARMLACCVIHHAK